MSDKSDDQKDIFDDFNEQVEGNLRARSMMIIDIKDQDKIKNLIEF